MIESPGDAILTRFRRFYETAPLPDSCIHCPGRHVVRNGSAKRTASLRVQDLVVFLTGILVRRVKCRDCHKSWRLLPPGLVPYRHYQLCVVADGASHYLFDASSTLESTAARCSCSRFTVARWVGWLADLARPADLQARIAEVAGLPILAPVRKVATKAWDVAAPEILDRAAAVLSLLEALGQAAGLEPPGLRAVLGRLLRVVRPRSTYDTPFIPEFAHIGIVPGWCSMEA